MNKTTIVFRKQQTTIDPTLPSKSFKDTISKSPTNQKSLVQILKKPIQKGQ